jgi:hypothetical protein
LPHSPRGRSAVTAPGAAGPARPAAGPLSDPYVRRNIFALIAIEIARGSLRDGDKRIYPALCRRGLVWEEPAGCWHLTADAEQAAREPEPG